MAIDTIKSTAVLDGAIATADIANDAVTTAKLGSITDIASSSGAMTLSPAGTEILNVGTTGDILVKGQGNNRAALVLRAGSNTANSQLQLGDQSSDFVGRIMYDHSDDTMRFQTNGSERVRISASGIHIGGTGAANALDDYEEGTWTPTIGGSGATYTNQQGLYTKVGRYVCAAFDITVNVRNSGSTNELHGFPFTANTGVSPAMGVYSGHISYYSGVSQNLYSLDMYIINGQTYAYFTGHTSASGNIGNSLAVWQNGTRILGTVHYFAN